MIVHHSVAAEIVIAPDPVQQGIAAHRPVLMLQQIAEYGEFLGRQLHLIPAGKAADGRNALVRQQRVPVWKRAGNGAEGINTEAV